MKKGIFTIFLCGMLLLSGCAAPTSEKTSEQDALTSGMQEQNTETQEEASSAALRIAALKGPTSMGLVKMMQDHTENTYTMYTSADEIVPLIAKGEVDIALIPANLAATLYQKTEGAIQVIGINTLSVLEIVTADQDIHEIEDLVGKTIYMTGKGTTPEYALQHILELRGLAIEQLQIEFKAEATEVVSALTEDPSAVGILPQPFATVAMMQNNTLHNTMHLGNEWAKASSDGSELVTGVTIMRSGTDLKAVKEFLNEHFTSVEYVNSHLEESAKLVELAGIVKAQVAQTAIPYCNLVSITGEEMKTTLAGYLEALYEMAPDAVGGKMPDEAFYYLES